ncbi:MAG TPA: YCF48-related protein [Pseudomonas sp.]|nr:YCF48-related protein [Pseudomonas sp.]
MPKKDFTPVRLLLVCALLAGANMVLHSRAAERAPAMRLAQAQQAPLVAVSRAGERLVAVGDYGVVALSDGGQDWRQARAVPVDTLLTAVSFADTHNGWAVGHGGVLLHTRDAGEHWALQQQLEGKPVLLSVWFENSRHGIVTGAYGYASETQDGGQSWQRLGVGAEDNDYHLNQIFAGPNGSLFIAAEGGNAYRSRDNGVTWEALDTGASGSLWSGSTLRDGRVLLVGMSGRVLLSEDRGDSWRALDSGSQEAITAVTQLADGRVVVVGNGGLVSVADADLKHFSPAIREDRSNLSALLTAGGDQLTLFSPQGVLHHQLSSRQ